MSVPALATTLAGGQGRAGSAEDKVHRYHRVLPSHSLLNESAPNGSETET